MIPTCPLCHLDGRENANLEKHLILPIAIGSKFNNPTVPRVSLILVVKKYPQGFLYSRRKVIGARYYQAGFQAELELNETVSFNSARDSNGHGTHTASTAAGRIVPNTNYKGLASGIARGGAPTARLAIYKACWKDACFDADILAAFDDAIHDGVHILSLSLGTSGPQADYSKDAVALGSFHAVSQGIVIVTSVGNEGTSGSASNIAPWMITVGASSIDRDFTSDINLGNGAHFSVKFINLMNYFKQFFR